MTREYIAYLSSDTFLSGEEVLRVTADGEFIWHERADELIASGDYTQYPALRYVLMALRENERLREENRLWCSRSALFWKCDTDNIIIERLRSAAKEIDAALRQEET